MSKQAIMANAEGEISKLVQHAENAVSNEHRMSFRCRKLVVAV